MQLFKTGNSDCLLLVVQNTQFMNGEHFKFDRR